MIKAGVVYLVGAGPGAPGLITVRGMELLQNAQVVLFDRLVDERLLRYVGKGAEATYVGKYPHAQTNIQEQTIRYMIEKAREGKSVVRLKGGDPFVFGRGGEEALALTGAGIPFEIVPGITSAIAAATYAGIPLTHRHMASSFTVVSGSEYLSKEEPLVDWNNIATGSGTLVVLMGWESLPHVVTRLLANGMAADTPVALVQWATEPYQCTVEGSLGNILERGRRAALEPPVVAVIGSVVRLREQIRWYDKGPLFGKRVMVTRSQSQAGTLTDMLDNEGAEIVEVPSIQVVPSSGGESISEAIRTLAIYKWIVFTSVNAVKIFWDALEKEGRDARALGNTKVAVIGPATAASLRQLGIRADVIPEQYVSEALVEALTGCLKCGDRVLLPRAKDGRQVLVDGLRALGASVDEVVAYETTTPETYHEKAAGMLSSNEIDVVMFTSSTGIRNLVAMLGGETALLSGPAIACIGPATRATAVELGVRVDIQAKEYTIPALVEAVKAYFTGSKIIG